MGIGNGIPLPHGFTIIEIQPKRDVWVEKIINGKAEEFRIFWADLNQAQKNQMLSYCEEQN